MENDLLYQVGLTLLEGVGDVSAKNLLLTAAVPKKYLKLKSLGLPKYPVLAKLLLTPLYRSSTFYTLPKKKFALLKKTMLSLCFLHQTNTLNA